VFYGFDDGGDPDDARLLRVVIQGLPIINTYVPQGASVDDPKFQKKLKFFADLKKFFAQTIKPGQAALWMGDLNVAPTEMDLWDPERNQEHVCFHPKTRAAYENVCGKLWVDLFREREKGPGHYTFWDYLWPKNFEHNRGWRIDLMLGTPPMVRRLKRIWIDKAPRTQERPSDHTILAAEFSWMGA
jgi:exodeoxyribonuclease-3